MGVDTVGFTAKKSIKQVLKAMRDLGYIIDNDVFESMNQHGMINFYMIPISRKGVQRVVSYGIYASETNGLAEALPKTGRKLKNSKQFSHFSLGANDGAFQIIQETVGALGGGYIKFMDTSSVPAVEVDEKGSLVDNNTGKYSPSIQILRNKIRALVYFNRNSFVDLPKGYREKVFINNELTDYKPVLIYKVTDNRVFYTVYANKDNQLFIDSSSYFGDAKLFGIIESYAKKQGIFMDLRDIIY